MTNQPPIASADLKKTQQVTSQAKTPEQTLVGFMNQPAMKSQLAAALPRHMTADRMIRIVTTEIRKNPTLAQCNTQSFVGAVVQCSQLGLEPGGALGHAYLLPFEKRKKGADGKWYTESVDIQLIIGYRGMIDLARRSGQIVSLSARVVRSGDDFAYEYGLEEKLHHRPGDDESSPITHVYSVAKLKDGGVQFEVMSANQVNQIAGQSKSVKKDNSGNIDWGNTKSPWATHWEEMAKKTVIRRLFKYLPVSIEMQKAVILDEKAESDIDQDNASVISAEYSVLNGENEQGNYNEKDTPLS